MSSSCAGLLEPLLEELRHSDDTLTCLTALEMVRELAEGADAETAWTLASSVIPALLALITNPNPLLQSQALKVGSVFALSTMHFQRWYSQ